MILNVSNFKRAYVWQLPVRVFHWFNALSILVLCVTGYIISDPPALLSSADATEIYRFGIVRFIHFVAAYVFVIMISMRFYWAFVGNRYARWSAYWPFTRKALRNIFHVLKIDILLLNEKNRDIRDISVGHNTVAAMAYIAFFLLFLIMIFTGFGLYSSMTTAWFPNLFSWVVPLLGGDFAARLVHHSVMWPIILITIIHVYLVFYHDWLEGRGEVSSMISGYKFVLSERFPKEKTEIIEEKK